MAGPQTISVPTGGATVSSTAFGAPVANTIAAILNPAHGMFYQTTATTSIANSTTVWTPVGFDTEYTDTANGHSTTTNPARYTVPTGWQGLYVVQGSVIFTGNATGQRWAAVGVNGLTPQNGTADGTALAPNSSSFSVSTYAEIVLAAGDYVQLLALQSSGGTLATTINGAFTSSMTVRWVASL